MKMAAARAIRSRVVGVVTVGALAGAAVVASLAIAHNFVFSNQATVAKATATGVYKGRVLSGNARCKRNREVQVYRADVNPDVRLGTVYTNPVGTWYLAGPALPIGARVYALIETKVLNQPGHNHSCGVDRSARKTIPYP